MKMLKILIVFSIVALTSVFSSGILFAQGAPKSFSSSARQAKASAAPNQTTEKNTITVVDTSAIKLVTRKDGTQGFRLRNLDVLWSTRAACCAIVSLFMILFVMFSPAKTSQGLIFLSFISGCSLTLAFYPLGASLMIYEWNPTYSLAVAAAGIIMLAFSLSAGYKLSVKIKAFKAAENQAQAAEIPNIFPGDNTNKRMAELSKGNVMPGTRQNPEQEFPDIFPGIQK